MKLLLVIFSLLTTQAFAHEKILKTRADSFAHGKFLRQKSHPWPFALLSIGHNMQSYQNYSASPYWHDGLDIRGNDRQQIFSATAGKIVNIENYAAPNPLYWEVAVKDADGFVWKYHHVAKDSIPQKIHEAYVSGAEIEAGEPLGQIETWPVASFGETYHHLHLLVVGADGRYINPFLMMEPLSDTQAPVINKIGLAQSHKPIAGNEVKGPHSLYLDASDLVYHEKFILPPHKISYRLDKKKESNVWTFVHLPSGKNDTDFINDFYLEGTCGNYRCRKFYINLNFSIKNPRGTMTLPPGSHEVEVSVEDVVGNKATKSFKWKVL